MEGSVIRVEYFWYISRMLYEIPKYMWMFHKVKFRRSSYLHYQYFSHCFIQFTGCNRTYYGVIGKTYDLELHRPKGDKIPFICYLTFVASGGQYGELVQVQI